MLRDIQQIGTELDVVTDRNGDHVGAPVDRGVASKCQLLNNRAQFVVRQPQRIEINEQRRVSRMQVADPRIMPGLE